MKRLTYLALAIAFIIGIALTFDACKKESDPEDNPPDSDVPVYSETGEATVGPAGGTIKVVDASSPINGASIVIPEGALTLTENVEIKLEPSTNDYSEYDLGDIIIVNVTPHGLTFEKNVELTLPFSSSDQTIGNTIAVHMEPDPLAIEVMPIKIFDKNKKLTTILINHLSDYSTYLNDSPEVNIDYELYLDQGRVVAYLGITKSLKTIPPYLQNVPEDNMYDLIDNRPDNSSSFFHFRLYEVEQSGYYKWVAANSIRIEYTKDPMKVKVFGEPALKGYHYEQLFSKEVIDFDHVIDPWMQGFATVSRMDEGTFIDGGYELSSEKTYVMEYSWAIKKKYPNPTHTWSYIYQHIFNVFKVDELGEYTEDVNLNSIIDKYETEVPNAVFMVSPLSGTTETIFEFDASGCSDNEDPVEDLQVRWDFDGDGSWDTEWSTNKVENHQYLTDGSYTVAMEVKDTDGITSSYSGGVEVNETGNSKPTAIFSVNPTSGTTETVFELDASASTDYEDPIEDLMIRWDFENDGVWDSDWTPNKIATGINYSFEGEYSIKLEVKDTGGLTDEATKQIEITEPITTPPVAEFSANPTTGEIPLTVYFTDQSINNPTSWYWDFGDGGTSTQQNPEHYYNTGGTYTVSLTATNSFGSNTKEKVDYILVNGTGGPCPGMPTITDIDGNTYKTVLIGNQCWMAENLKTTTYSNGTMIPNVTDGTLWPDLTSGAFIWYDNDISWKDLYGALYNWYATVDPNDVCPEGWHVPTEDEWSDLTDFIGGIGSPHGNELKSCRQKESPLGGDCNTTEHPYWAKFQSEYGTDDYGFSGLPGGSRGWHGQFGGLGVSGHYWSTTTDVDEDEAMALGMSYNTGGVWINSLDKYKGYAVRCIKD